MTDEEIYQLFNDHVGVEESDILSSNSGTSRESDSVAGTTQQLYPDIENELATQNIDGQQNLHAHNIQEITTTSQLTDENLCLLCQVCLPCIL